MLPAPEQQGHSQQMPQHPVPRSNDIRAFLWGALQATPFESQAAARPGGLPPLFQKWVPALTVELLGMSPASPGMHRAGPHRTTPSSLLAHTKTAMPRCTHLGRACRNATPLAARGARGAACGRTRPTAQTVNKCRPPAVKCCDAATRTQSRFLIMIWGATLQQNRPPSGPAGSPTGLIVIGGALARLAGAISPPTGAPAAAAALLSAGLQ